MFSHVDLSIYTSGAQEDQASPLETPTARHGRQDLSNPKLDVLHVNFMKATPI